MTWILVRIYIVPVDNGARVPPDAARRFIDQIKNDALYGTYGTLDRDYWRTRMEFKPETLSEAEIIGDPHPDNGLVGYEFELRLAVLCSLLQWVALRISLGCWRATCSDSPYPQFR
jgi:hypothetical protein